MRYLFDSPMQLVRQDRHDVFGTEIDILGHEGGCERDADVEEAVVGRVSVLAGENPRDADEVGAVSSRTVGVLLVVFSDEDQDALRAGQLLAVDYDVGAPFATGGWSWLVRQVISVISSIERRWRGVYRGWTTNLMRQIQRRP